MAAQIIVTQPDGGRIDVLNSDRSSYTVRFVGTSGTVVFSEFKVVCHYCERTLYSSTNNPAIFDLSSLEDSGHPGPFEITAATGPSSGNVLLQTFVAEGSGVTSPVSQWLIADSGGWCRGRITATPDEGWIFVGWSRTASGAIEHDSATYSFTTKAPAGGDGHIEFYAHFKRETFKPALYYDISAVPEPNHVGFHRDWWNRHSFYTEPGRLSHDSAYNVFGPDGTTVTLDFRYTGEVRDEDGTVVKEYISPFVSDSVRNTFARLTATPSEGFEYGGALTVKLEKVRLDMWNAFGFAFLGWRIAYEGETGSTAYVDDFVADTTPEGDETVSFVADKLSLERLRSGSTYAVHAVIGAANVFNLEFVCKAGDAASISVRRAAYVDYSRSTAGKVVAKAVAGNPVVLRVDAIHRPHGFVHGWSESLPYPSGNSYAFDVMGSVAAKLYTMPDHDARVAVYVCSHRLLYGTDSSQLLHGRSGQLLYDCSVPPGTTVYD